MTGDITLEQAKAYADELAYSNLQNLLMIRAEAAYREQVKMLERKLVVFAMSGAFINELSLVHEPNGLWYNARIW